MTRSGTIQVRPMARDDATEVATLAGQLGYPSTPAQIETRFRPLAERSDSCVLVATGQGDAVVGWIHVFADHLLVSDGSAEVGGLVVDEKLRGTGVGTLLLQAAERWAVERGYGEVWIRSNVIRKETHAFYQRRGYEIVKSQHKFRKRPG